ncbi:MAG: hypothetical protein ACHQF2_06075 [Flavobacteriales bacterium]
MRTFLTPMLQTRFALLVIAVLFLSCKKQAIKVDENFEGSWKQFNVYVISEITIPHKGKATYHAVVGTDVNDQKGVAKINKKKNELYIGMKKWHIDAYPYQENDPNLGGAVWKMTLDGVGHYRPQ